MSSDEEQFRIGLERASADDLYGVVRAALVLERELYASERVVEVSTSLYSLRKALEAIFGHDLPEVANK